MTETLHTIACIDDDEDILRIASLSLEAMGGLATAMYAQPDLALAGMARSPPDLILLDVMMPEMDGPTFLAELRSRPILSQIPVVFMTARVQAADLRQYKLLGAAGVVAKPFDPLKLVGELQEIWRSWRSQESRQEPAIGETRQRGGAA